MTTNDGCVFCRIIDSHEPGEIIPRKHVTDATVDPVITTMVARRAAQVVRPGQHIAVNVREDAGQTVFHLHWHVFTCRGGKRCMPWGCPE